jgi:hypothetical protein
MLADLLSLQVLHPLQEVQISLLGRPTQDRDRITPGLRQH